MNHDPIAYGQLPSTNGTRVAGYLAPRANSFGSFCAGIWNWLRGVLGCAQAIRPCGINAYTWHTVAEALVRSSHVLESQHVFVGILDEPRARPILVHRGDLAEHVAILGKSGSGKNTRLLASLETQVLARKDCSFLHVDCKGDLAHFHYLRLLAQQFGIPFWYVTIDPRRPTYAWNPFLEPFWRRLSIPEQVEILGEALDLNAGSGYGYAYFTDQTEFVNKRAVAKGQLASFTAFIRRLNDPKFYTTLNVSQKQWEAASHLVSACDRGASIPALNVTPEQVGIPSLVSSHQFSLTRLLARPGIGYFFLPAGLAATDTALTARMVIQSAVAGARIHEGRRVPLYLVVDEAQVVFSRALATTLPQARDVQISFWLSFQTLSAAQLNTINLTDTIMNNTSLQLILSAGDTNTARFILDNSGEQERLLETWSPDRDGVLQTSYRQTIAPIIGPNDVAALNSAPDLCYLRLIGGRGYGALNHPCFVHVPYIMSRREYARLKSLPWPKATPSTFLAMTVAAERAVQAAPQRFQPLPSPPPPEKIKPEHSDIAKAILARMMKDK